MIGLLWLRTWRRQPAPYRETVRHGSARRHPILFQRAVIVSREAPTRQHSRAFRGAAP